MSEQLLFVLKLCLLALLYLFFYRVVRAVWAELKAPAVAPAGGGATRPAKPSRQDRKAAKAVAEQKPPQLVVVEPASRRGQAFLLGNEATLGRAAGCQVPLDDTFVSQLHARVFLRNGTWFVEDLGSTNGTLLNKRKVGGAVPIQRGDRVQIGSTVLEMVT